MDEYKSVGEWTNAWIGGQMDWWMDKQIRTDREADRQTYRDGEMG